MLLYLSDQGEGAYFSFLTLMMLPTFSFCHPSTTLLLIVPLSEKYQLCQETLRDREAHPSPLLKKLLQEVPWVWAEKKPPQDWQNITPCGSSVDQPSHPSEAEAISHVNRSKVGNVTPCGTPLLPVLKPGTRDYQPVQDLREVNCRVETVHPTVPNPILC